MNCPTCARPMNASMYRADSGQRWQLYTCCVCEVEIAMDDETCPVCNAVMEPHTVLEDERLYEVWYCDSCMADYLPVGFNEWRGLNECHGTRPIPAIITSEVNDAA